MTVRRGEIYWVEFGPVKGSEQGGLRPALVVQNDIGNRHSSTTVMVAITRTIPSQPYPFVVVIEPSESGLPTRSAINCTQMATIQQSGATSRLRPAKGDTAVRPIGRLSHDKMREVSAALAYSLAI
ncbi:MAG: type II toxin-antitoxin system PemK/MazF family toxin [Caldilinea sp.]|jgi:mRNA interferase MazF